MSEEHRDSKKLRIFPERAALQQAESSIPQRRALSQAQPSCPEKGIRNVTFNQLSSKAPMPPKALVKSHLGSDRDVRHTIDARRRGHEHDEDEGSRAPHPRRGRWSESAEDQSPSPDASGPRVFGSRICNAPFPQRYRPPTNIMRYTGVTNPGL